jgi:hypothetical protein
MQAFLSHAASDSSIALFLKDKFEEIGVDLFVMPLDAPTGRWQESIRRALNECDVLFTLHTPDSHGRPWIAAEWAAFWVRDMDCHPLLVDVRVSDIWEPMRAWQSADLLDRRSLGNFLAEIAETTGQQPAEGTAVLARRISEELPAVRRRQLLQRSEEVMTFVSMNLKPGTDNISPEWIHALVESGRITDLVDMAVDPTSTEVKRKQVAIGLVAESRLGEALSVTKSISNRAEAKNVGLFIVDRMESRLGPESEEWQFLNELYHLLGPNQRRDILERMRNRNLPPLGPWLNGA